MTLRVECYSSHKADERPVRFQLDDRAYVVEELLDQWYGTDDVFFKVWADDGNLYVLRHKVSVTEDTWHLEAFLQLQSLRSGSISAGAQIQFGLKLVF
jgi:hypothetical protein